MFSKQPKYLNHNGTLYKMDMRGIQYFYFNGKYN